jgi:uncharacterized protein (TIGR03083 family)
VAAVRREGQAIVAAGGQDDVPIPTCGDWQTADLLRHVAQIYEWVAHVVGDRVTARPDKPEIAGDVDLVEHLADRLDDLVAALSSTDPDTPVWNWSSEPDVAAFWARRMAHESAVHRYDAQRAHGLAQPIDAELAHDGFDELLDVIAPRVLERDGSTPDAATYSFLATDEGAWHVRLGPDGIERLDVAKEPDVTVRGTTSALLLATCNRVPWSSLDVEGDTACLDAWSAALRF